MNKLNDCETYNSIQKVFGNTIDILKDSSKLKKYVIPRQFYDYKLRYLVSKKSPLLKPAVKACLEDKVQLFNLSDPKDISNKKDKLILPSYFTVWPGKDITGKNNYVMYSNAGEKSDYERDSLDEPVNLNIKENALVALIQNAYAARVCLEKDADVTNNVKLQEDMAEIYATLIAPCIDNVYSILTKSGQDDYNKLVFLCAVFYFEFFAGYDPEKAVSFASKLKNIDFVSVVKDDRVMDSSAIDMKSFNDFSRAIEIEFPYIKKGTITLRAIIAKMSVSYGSGTMFMAEHFQTLLSVVLSVGSMGGLFTDRNIRSKISGVLLDDVSKLIYTISGVD